jgi:hypothetical protein
MQGKIADFGIPDIFQLVSSQSKSGSLAISGNDRVTIFLFADGKIVDVQPDRREPRSLLGTMLRDAGLLTDSELTRFLDAQGGAGKKIGELLVEKGKISREVLFRYLTLQIKECLFEALLLTEGEYRFEGFAVRPTPWSGEPIRPDVLLMEGMQFLDEYPRYREKFPPGAYRVSRRKGERVDPNALTEPERTLWRALDYSDDPDRVFRKACMTGFDGIKGIAALRERGLVEVFTPQRERDDPAHRLRGERVFQLRFERGLAALWAVAAGAVAAWLYGSLLSPGAAEMFTGWVRFF